MDLRLRYILRSYDRQRSSWAGSSESYRNKEEVTFSREAKRKILADKIVQKILGQFKSGKPLEEEIGNILEQLSQEYGERLEISHQGKSGIVFKVLDKHGRTRVLSADENRHLETRLFNITRSSVYKALSEISDK